MPAGVDVGAARIVGATGEGTAGVANAVQAVEDSEYVAEFLDGADALTVSGGGERYAIGDAAPEVATMSNDDPARIVGRGAELPEDVAADAVEAVLGEVAGEGSGSLRYAASVTGDGELIEDAADALGYDPAPVDPGMAVLYDHLTAPFTGLGVVVDGTSTVATLAVDGVPVATTVLERGGDWIDREVAAASGSDPAEVAERRAEASLADASANGLALRYDTLLSNLALAVADEAVAVDEPVPVVIGGSAAPDGVDARLADALVDADLPFAVASVDRVAMPEEAAARGALVAAEAGGDVVRDGDGPVAAGVTGYAAGFADEAAAESLVEAGTAAAAAAVGDGGPGVSANTQSGASSNGGAGGSKTAGDGASGGAAGFDFAGGAASSDGGSRTTDGEDDLFQYTGEILSELDDRLETLEARLGVEDDEPLDAVVDGLRADVDDLAELRSDVASLRDELDELSAAHEALDADLDDVAATAEDVEATTEELAASTDELAETTDDLEATTDDLDERVASLASSLEDVEASVEALEDSVAAVEEVAEDVERVESDVEGLADDVAALEEDGDDAEQWLEAIDDDLEEVEDEVEALRSDVDDVEETVTTVDGSVAELDEGLASVVETVEERDERVADLDERLEDLRDRLDDVDEAAEDAAATAERIDEVESQLEAFVDDAADAETVVALRERLDVVETAVEDAEAELEDVPDGDDLDSLREEQASLADEQAALADDVETVGERLDDLRAVDERVDELEEALPGDEVETLPEDVEALRDRVATLEETIDDEVDAVADDVERLAARVDEETADADAVASLEHDLSTLDDSTIDLQQAIESLEAEVGELREQREAALTDVREELDAELADVRSQVADVPEDAVPKEQYASSIRRLERQLGDLEDELDAVEQSADERAASTAVLVLGAGLLALGGLGAGQAYLLDQLELAGAFVAVPLLVALLAWYVR